jgi:hypothetical protein
MYKKSAKYSFWNTKQKKYSNKNHNSFNISYCSNCGYKGHVYKECPEPKISLGIIAFSYDHSVKDVSSRYKYLLICRKHTLGFVDFIRGKYNLLDINYLKRLIDQLTNYEKQIVMEKSFIELWNILWFSKDTNRGINCIKSNKQRKEYYIAENKFNTLRNGYNIVDNKIQQTFKILNNAVLEIENDNDNDNDNNYLSSSNSNSDSETSENSCPKNEINNYYDVFNIQDTKKENDTSTFISLGKLIKQSKTKWETPEWGFPKGRRNLKESNLDCSKREFMEETGLIETDFNVYYNINTLEESFLGTNNIPYKNIYYIGNVKELVSLSINMEKKCQASEVSQLGFYDLDTCLEKIRPYNKEKIKILLEANKIIRTHKLEIKDNDFYSNVSTYNFKKGGKV